MAKFRIDLGEHTISILDDPETVYEIPELRWEILLDYIKANGRVIPYDIMMNRHNISKKDLADAYNNQLKRSIRKAFGITKDSPLHTIVSKLMVNKSGGYYFDNSANDFIIIPPKRQTSSEDNDITTRLCNNLINTVDSKCKEDYGFIQEYFPQIEVSNDKKYTYDRLIDELRKKSQESGRGICEIIESPSCSGKTSLLRQISKTLDDRICPILVTSNEIQKNSSFSSHILRAYAGKDNITESDSKNDLISLLHRLQSSNYNEISPLILIDGYDEMDVDTCKEVLESVRSILEEKTIKTNFIITTRYVNPAMRKFIEAKDSLFKVSHLSYLDRSVLGEYEDVNIEKITPLVAKFYNELSSKEDNLKIKNKFDLYDLYYKHTFDDKTGYITKYKNFYPYIAYRSVLEPNLVLNTRSLGNMYYDAFCDYSNLFVESDISISTVDSTLESETSELETLARLIKIPNDLVRSDLLTRSSGDIYSFSHDEIRLFMASKFLNIKLKAKDAPIEEILEEFLKDYIKKLGTDSFREIYNNHIDYCEFCFMAIVDALGDKTISDNSNMFLLRFGLLVGYHQKYSVFSALEPLIDRYFKKPENTDFYTIAAINDYLYSTIKANIPLDKKEKLLSNILTKLLLCKSNIEILKEKNESIDKDKLDSFGSAKHIMDIAKGQDSTKNLYDALLGVIHGNIGACHLEKANSIYQNNPEQRETEIGEAITNHNEGIIYKQESFGALHRNYISLASDHYYLSQCIDDLEEKRERINKALCYYKQAAEELKKHSTKTIDSFVIPFNKAGCYYEAFHTYDDSDTQAECARSIHACLLDGLNNLKDYLNDDKMSSLYISQNIHNIYISLKDKYLPLFLSEKNRNPYKSPKYYIDDNLKGEIKNFCETYNEISFYDKIELKVTEIDFTEVKK